MLKQVKGGQITIFVIIAILLVAGISLFFVLRGGEMISFEKPSISNPQAYIEKCAEDAGKEVILIMMPQGGYTNPVNYKLYKSNKVEYLCYTPSYYSSCTMREPLYIEHLEDEIEIYVQDRVEDCFYNLEQEYKNKHYKVDMSNPKTEIELKSKRVDINIDNEVKIEKGDEKRRYDEFKVSFNSPIYNLGIIAQEIASQESKYCNFEYKGFNMLYPKTRILRTSVGYQDSATRIYTLEDKASGKKLNIAIRSCISPVGI